MLAEKEFLIQHGARALMKRAFKYIDYEVTPHIPISTVMLQICIFIIQHIIGIP